MKKRHKTSEAETPESVYNEFWKDLVETDGKMDPEKVKAELYDFRQLIRNIPKVYDAVTGGRISKPLTDVDVVISEFNDYVERCVSDAILERDMDDH
jgi:hypothetical protein